MSSSSRALVYYDQRGTGRSDADMDSASINLDTFVEDIDELIMEYRIADTDGKQYTIQKPLTWFVPQDVPFSTSDEAPRIGFRDTNGNGISAVEYRILSKQNVGASQEEFFDLVHHKDIYLTMDNDWFGLFIDPCAVDPTLPSC